MLMATPQKPIAHDGSVTVTSVKALIASSYQNECSSATARANCSLAAGLHETGKVTVPSFSPLAPCALTTGAQSTPVSTASRSTVVSLMAHLPNGRPRHLRLTAEKSVCQLRSDTRMLPSNLSSA